MSLEVSGSESWPSLQERPLLQAVGKFLPLRRDVQVLIA
jgi:hypothetical protein